MRFAYLYVLDANSYKNYEIVLQEKYKRTPKQPSAVPQKIICCLGAATISKNE